ncbi:MAG: UbiD family decarboxylase [Chloroflexi bacterium]|nr:UbiD family decarboxylase [Chloroflexota bacterium]
MPYRDLREYIARLEQGGRLKRIKKEVDKDWEIAAVCRKVFQKIPPERRSALLFEHVRGFTIPVAVGLLGASPEVYALALETTVDQIGERWDRALSNPIPPRLVEMGPCKENILKGDDVDLLKLPVPTWTVGQDPAPFFTSPYVCTKDPISRVPNVGCYRMQLKGKNKTGIFADTIQHMNLHMQAAEARGESLPVAVIVGAEPTIGYVAVTKVPFGVDEFAVAGGLRGEPVELVKCETVDLEVPATAEIIIEGEVPPYYREPEGPFGEFPGYMGAAGDLPIINVKCITHRHHPIYQAFFSQMPPSESSCIKAISREWTIYKHLKRDLGLPIVDVHLKESGASIAYLVISLKKQYEGQPKQVMWAAWSVDSTCGKITVVVDDDIDIRDPFALEWALSFRMQPARDIIVMDNVPAVALDPSIAPPHVPQTDRARLMGSKIGIDATRKHEYPALALPPAEHLELVEKNWIAYGFT